MQLKKSIQVLLVALGIIAVPIIIVVAAWLYWTDEGLRKFTGVEHWIAKRAVVFERSTNDISPLPRFVLRVHVDEVREITAREKAEHCTDPQNVGDDPSNVRNYAVRMTRQRGGEAAETVTHYGCDIMKFDLGTYEYSPR